MRSMMLVAMVAVVVLLAACGVPAPAGPGPVPPSPSGAMAVEPGLRDLGGGRTAASGWVARVDLEGGFWALCDAAPTPARPQPAVVAVLLPGTVSEGEIAAASGRFATAEGTLSTGASVRMAGPELVVSSLQVLGRGE